MRRTHEAGKIIGIISRGGLIAISAKIVEGRKTKGSLVIKEYLINDGGIWTMNPRSAIETWFGDAS